MLGMRVKIRHSLIGEIDLRNVTEIHYAHQPVLEGAGGPRVAFESDIHVTGMDYRIAEVLEFEVTLETEVVNESSNVVGRLDEVGE